uniref:Vomeronasal type-1 receptor n=1 Tax=Ornithorhynchus anatinus TaxID=9258 RepID=A0A6I8N9K4_ORNAN
FIHSLLPVPQHLYTYLVVIGMDFNDKVRGICFLFQTGVAIIGNSLLLVLHACVFLLGQRPKPTDLIIAHLSLVHVMMLLIRVVTVTMSSLGLDLIQTNVGCKIFAYMYRITRSLSFSTTCLLSVVQAITMSPSSSLWAQLKPLAPKCVLPACTFFCILNLLTETNLLLQLCLAHNGTSRERRFNDNYCSTVPLSTPLLWLFLTFKSVRDVFTLGLMSCSSGYMVLLLYQHRQQTLHLHSSYLSPKSSPERRATQTILLLVSFFIAFYCADFVLFLFLGTSLRNDFVLLSANMFVVNGFATVSPLVLLSSHPWSLCNVII